MRLFFLHRFSEQRKFPALPFAADLCWSAAVFVMDDNVPRIALVVAKLNNDPVPTQLLTQPAFLYGVPVIPFHVRPIIYCLGS